MATAVNFSGMLLSGCLGLTCTTAAEIPPAAYQLATYGSGVPAEVLYALAMQESGILLRGTLISWPWTLNVAGKPYRCANRDVACTALLQALNQVDAKDVDAGLGQINLGWNSSHFVHPCEALNPYRNLQVATALLEQHKTSDITWITAAGRYHRPAGGLPAARYRTSFANHLSRITQPPLQGTKSP
ncbi:lytic transglycosylase [Pseudomonas fluorescens]|nr:lytic transglycosylase [Pseudomonas fluorescens]